jgi:hypothetical protein
VKSLAVRVGREPDRPMVPPEWRAEHRPGRRGRTADDRSGPGWSRHAVAVVVLAVLLGAVLWTHELGMQRSATLAPADRPIIRALPSAAPPRPVPSPPPSPLTVQDKLADATTQAFGAEHVPAMDALISHESGHDPLAINPSSGACGLFQAHPCAKMRCALDDVDCQIRWGIGYIEQRYGDPTTAWEFWNAQSPHWY